VAEPGPVLVSLSDVVKDYRALRPLRIQSLELHEGERVSLLGVDQASAEVLVNLIAGATLPDAGTVHALGRPTSAITDGETWLKSLDDFGIVSERAVLLEALTVEQNLAVPLSLDLHDLPTDTRARVAAVATEVGLAPEHMAKPTAALSALDRLRLRLARAIAVDPKVLMAEHPNAGLSPAEQPVFAEMLVRVAETRRLALLVLTADAGFAAAVSQRVLTLNAATGQLTDTASRWRKWFR
jgi:ABC-type transporter Mla maintaining outer membrane lipid asymmetry ATPase subunit MlaF